MKKKKKHTRSSDTAGPYIDFFLNSRICCLFLRASICYKFFRSTAIHPNYNNKHKLRGVFVSCKMNQSFIYMEINIKKSKPFFSDISITRALEVFSISDIQRVSGCHRQSFLCQILPHCLVWPI